jgi:hypothetical protein
MAGTPDELAAAIEAAARQVGAARLAKIVTAGLAADGGPGQLHPDVVTMIEKLTGETYNPETGAWEPGPERPGN